MPRSLALGGYTFPTRDDYLARYVPAGQVDELDEETIIAIQREHQRGQNGCVFAMHAARKLPAEQWRYEVHRTGADIDALRHSVQAAVADPHNEILSLIFSRVACEAGVSELVDLALSAGFYQAAGLRPESGVAALRYRVGASESWVIGFAPLSTLPPTRQAPFTELAIRTKPKSQAVHPDLNNDLDQAHLADVDLKFDPTVVASLISKSKARTARLGMQETEKRVGLAIEAAHLLKMAADDRYSRKAVVRRTILVKVDNGDYSPSPDASVDIKTKLVGDQAVLSVKTGSWHGATARQEYEVNFHRTDFGNLLTILRLFGYRRFILLVTTRTIWTGNGVVITLDEYHKLGKALFEVELEDATTGDERVIDEVFASLDQQPMNSAQTIAFIADLNRAKETHVDLDCVAPDELARELAARH